MQPLKFLKVYRPETSTSQKQPQEVFCKKKLFLKVSQYSQENT